MKKKRTLGITGEYGDGKAVRLGSWWFGFTVCRKAPYFLIGLEVFPDHEPNAEVAPWSEVDRDEEEEDYYL
jgi:hypothetical protein